MLRCSKKSPDHPAPSPPVEKAPSKRPWWRKLIIGFSVFLLVVTLILSLFANYILGKFESKIEEAVIEEISDHGMEGQIGTLNLTVAGLSIEKMRATEKEHAENKWQLESLTIRPTYDNGMLGAKLYINRFTKQQDGKTAVAPLSVELSALWHRGTSEVPFEFSVRDFTDQERITGKGVFDYSKETLEMDIALETTSFETGVLQPDQLVPFLRGKFTNVSGSVSAEAHLSLNLEDMAKSTSNALLHLNDLSGMAGDTAIGNVNGLIVFDSLAPLTTPEDQVIQIGSVLAGLPLSDGTIVFNVTPDGIVHVSPSSWRLAGGRVSTEAFTMDSGSLKVEGFTLRADSLSLEELLAGALESGFSASGKLSGRIPLIITDGLPTIHGGVLKTDSEGVIKYTPPADGPLQKGNATQTDILLQALENFHYTDLSMKINNDSKEKLAIDLHLKGANPELYDGKPIELNVHLTGDILGLVQSGLDVYNLPERLQEQWLHGSTTQ